MKDLIIEKTAQTPKIEFYRNGKMRILGISTVSDAQKFYRTVIDWLINLKNDPPQQIDLLFEIYYVNTPSSLMFVEMLRQLNSLKSDKTDIKITWRYEEDDEDILSFGEEIEIATNSTFNYIVIN